MPTTILVSDAPELNSVVVLFVSRFMDAFAMATDHSSRADPCTMHSSRMMSDDRQFYEYARAIGMPAVASDRDEIDKLFSKLIEAIHMTC